MYHQQGMIDNIKFVTASCASHEKSLGQLLDSINEKYYRAPIDVWNLGLSEQAVNELTKRPYCSIKTYPFDSYDDFFAMCNHSGSYAWKPSAILSSWDHTFNHIIWMDAGNIISKKLIIPLIASKIYGIFVTRSKGRILDWTFPSSLFELARSSEGTITITRDILLSRNCSAAAVFFSTSNPLSFQILKRWAYYSMNRNIISPRFASKANHRYDQAILSTILAELKLQPLCESWMPLGYKIHQDLE